MSGEKNEAGIRGGYPFPEAQSWRPSQESMERRQAVDVHKTRLAEVRHGIAIETSIARTCWTRCLVVGRKELGVAEEASVASKYGQGPWAFFRGAMDEFSHRGMRNRVFLVFCAFALNNLSGASGMWFPSLSCLASSGLTEASYQLLLANCIQEHWRECTSWRHSFAVFQS